MTAYDVLSRISLALRDGEPLTLSPEELRLLREYDDGLLSQIDRLEREAESAARPARAAPGPKQPDFYAVKIFRRNVLIATLFEN